MQERKSCFHHQIFKYNYLAVLVQLLLKCHIYKWTYNHIYKYVPKDGISVAARREYARKYCLIWVVVFFQLPKLHFCT